MINGTKKVGNTKQFNAEMRTTEIHKICLEFERPKSGRKNPKANLDRFQHSFGWRKKVASRFQTNSRSIYLQYERLLPVRNPDLSGFLNFTVN